MPIVMLGEELHPDRAISIEKLYEIFNEYELPYNFPIQDGIEKSAFLAAKCEECQCSQFVNKYPRSLEEWGEDYGDVLWWKFPIEEPPYVGSPLNADWPGYHTHWLPIPVPKTPKEFIDD